MQKKIFVADDDADILQMMELILKSDGYNVMSSDDANMVFNIEPNSLPDLILLDIWMSGIDGRDICNRLKTNPDTQNIPVLFISANANIAEITEQSQADGFIEKPFDMYEFLEKVKSFVSPAS